MKAFNLLIRIIVSPFVFGLLIVKYTIGLLMHFWQFLRYGGEWATYSSREEGKTISDIYQKLKQNNL